MSLQIFLSTVSDEFLAYRDELRRDLTRHNVEVKVQEDFKEYGGFTLEKLDLYIASCDAVIHIVGDMTGSEPTQESVAALLAKHPDLPERLSPLRDLLARHDAMSYTQWEAWLSLYHKKILVTAEADARAPRGPHYAPTDASRAAQKQHIQRLHGFERYSSTFTSPDSLAKFILSSAILDLLATAHRAGVLFENVPSHDLNFTGRDAQLDDLHKMLMPDPSATPASCVAIHGLGGMGKSSFAAEYAYRHATDYAGVWWAQASDPLALIGSLARLAARLDPALAADRSDAEAARAALGWIAAGAVPFLLIYDNVESPDKVQDLLPSAGARVLITTRWQDWSGKAVEIGLDVLAAKDAVAFLQKRAGRSDDGEGAAQLAGELGFLPLALDHAGAYCAADRWLGFDEYRKRVQAHMVFVPKGAAYSVSVARTFELALEKAVSHSAAGEKLLSCLAFLDPQGVPIDLIKRAIPDETERSAALMALTEVSLIEHSQHDGLSLVKLHRLVQAAMRARLTQCDQTNAVIGLVAKCLVDDMKDRVENVAAVKDAVDRLHAEPFSDKWIQIAVLADGIKASGAAGTAFRHQVLTVFPFMGEQAAAEPLWRYLTQLIAIEARDGSPQMVKAVSFFRRRLAGCLAEAGRRHEAEQEYLSAIAGLEKFADGPNAAKIEVAGLHNDLGSLYVSEKEYAKAAGQFRSAVALAESEGKASNRAIIATCRSNLRYAESPPYRWLGELRAMAWPTVSNPGARKSIIRNAGILVAMIMVMTVVDLTPWFIKSPVLWGGLDLPLWLRICLNALLVILGGGCAYCFWLGRVPLPLAWAATIFVLPAATNPIALVRLHSGIWAVLQMSMFPVCAALIMIALLRAAYYRKRLQGRG